MSKKKRKFQNKKAAREIELLEKEVNEIENEEKSSVASDSPKRSGSPDKNTHFDFKSILNKQQDITIAMNSCQQKLDLPKKEILYFDGSNITQYKRFILSFERTVSSRCDSDADKFVYLQQFTTGKARKLVDTCCHRSPSLAYNKALELLNEEYDNEFIVSNAYISKLETWPSIKSEDKVALEDFYYFLLECHNYLENMTCRNPIESPREMHNVVLKLPYKMRERWRRKCLHITRACGYVGFSNLVDFVKEETDLLRQPVFGFISDSPAKTKTKIKDFSKPIKLLTTQAEVKSDPVKLTNVQYCLYCKKNNHSLNKCRFFEKLVSKEKSDFIKKTNLCFACLCDGHMSKTCKNRLTCSICSKKHPTILHFTSSPVTQKSGLTPTTARNAEDIPKICATKNDNKRKIITPVVPAKIKLQYGNQEVTMNCALDNCSTDCWLNEKLLHVLGIRPQETTINVTTMQSTNAEIKTKVINNLQVTDLDGNYSIVIPVVFTKPDKDWPFTADDLPTTDDTTNFEHLQDVPFKFAGQEIGLLIGMNVPAIIRPTKVVYGHPDDPFASLHPLGWAINGPVHRTGSNSYCHRAVAADFSELNSSIQSFFSQDYFDDSLDRNLSPNDKLWLDKAESNIYKQSDNHYVLDLPLKPDATFPNNRSQINNMFIGLKKRLDNNIMNCFQITQTL